MKILIVADGRSPIARNWIALLQAGGYKISLVSTYPCAPVDGIASLTILPVAFGRFAGSQVSTGAHVKQKNNFIRRMVGALRNTLVKARYSFGTLTLKLYRRQFLEAVEETKPNLVHALRIPFEGMLAAFTPQKVPFIVSIWGNDLTLHAHRNRILMKQTKQVLERADGLMADAHRDIRLAGEMGFDSRKPTLIIPGGGGIDLEWILQKHELTPEIEAMIPKNVPLVINPRGFRPGSVRNDVFFQAAALVIKEKPEVHFVCAAMAGQKEAEDWVRKLGIEKNVHLLPYLTQEQLWALFQRCLITVSVSEHDGTPNSLLEAMALGCFPICGDIESIREWIKDEKNGLLVDPKNPTGLKDAIIRALGNQDLRDRAKQAGLQVIKSKADRQSSIKLIDKFYQSIKLS
jgi:glycosyltransferase involved in cell wall biosynthesis